ncbi:MAG: outer membrane beta-barrel protein [Bacteroidales bacterium]|nr:outer membrane beta-barrel protein [Bacteroidales bacterium]
MMDKLNNIDQLFREELYDYSPPPPANGWERLENALSQSRKVPLAPVWMKIAASIFFAVGTTILAYILINPSEKNNTPATSGQSIAESTSPALIPATEESAPIAVAEIHETPSEKTVSENGMIAPTGSLIVSETPVESAAAPSEQEAILAQHSGNTPPAESNPLSADPEKMDDAESLSLAAAENPEKETNPELLPKKTTTLNVNELVMQQNILEIESAEKTKPGASWTVGGLVGPQYTYRDVNVNTIPYPINDYDNYESGVTTYAGGFQVEVEPAPRFSIQSGLYYSKIGQIKTTIEADQLYASIDEPWNSTQIFTNETSREHQSLPADLVNSTGNITFDKSMPPSVAAADPATEWVPGSFTAEQYFEFIEVPIVFRYRLIDRKFDMDISSGIWANFLIGNKAIATDNLNFETSGETEDINTLNYCGSLSLGFAYPLGPNVALSLEPFFKYYLKPINTNPQTEVYPYSMGVMTGVKYRF